MSDESPEEMYRRAARMRAELYPELEREDFHAFVRRLVREAGHVVAERGHSIRAGDRFAQPTYAALERLFLFDLWSKGVCYGNFKTEDPQKMADAIGAFVFGRMTIDELERSFPWVRFGDHARAHERGRLVEHEWHARLEWGESAATPLREALGPLLRACAARPRLRVLFPFTSLDRLLFSRTTGYPYESMATYARCVTPDVTDSASWLATVVPGRFSVVRRRGDDGPEVSLGEGDADWAAAALEQEVPTTWGPARDGTSDDSRRDREIKDVPDEPYNEVFGAVAHADSAALRAAILAGADVNEADLRPYVGHLNTPLHHAASLGNAELVRILLDAGARIDARCADGWTPLMRACNAGAFEAAKVLVEMGADIGARNSEGYTAEGRVPGDAPELLAFMRAHLRADR